MLDWREEYKRKLVSAEDAVKVVKSGDRVVIPLPEQPRLLPDMLAGVPPILVPPRMRDFLPLALAA